MPKNKRYLVNVDMKYSHEVTVSAKNAAEAKKKGFKRVMNFVKTRRGQFTVGADEIDENGFYCHN